MSDEFSYDVFLSHSSKDKAVVRPLAERLRKDGVKVWFDEWVLKPGDSIPAKIEEGLERSRVLVLCMSANAFGSDWAQLESGTFRFRDPLNKERRFLPLRLDDAPIKGSLAQFLYIDWQTHEHEAGYAKLLEACQLPGSNDSQGIFSREEFCLSSNQIAGTREVNSYAFSKSGDFTLAAGSGSTARLWTGKTSRLLMLQRSGRNNVTSSAISSDCRIGILGTTYGELHCSDLTNGTVLWEGRMHSNIVWSIQFSDDDRFILTSSWDQTVKLWDVQSGECLKTFIGHRASVQDVRWLTKGRTICSVSIDGSVRGWDVETEACLFEQEGFGHASSLAVDRIGRLVFVGSEQVVRVLDTYSGTVVRILEGHTGAIRSVALSADSKYLVTGANDHTIRLWSAIGGHCLLVLKGHNSRVNSVAWLENKSQAISGDDGGSVRVWDLTKILAESSSTSAYAVDEVQYTNAKVLLVGESGAGKTGLSKRLALNDWQPSDSTVGAWATHWKLPVSGGKGVEREVWLWDFGGQADQRLIHQLYMDETALAVLVFDGQKEDLFETLGQWDRDLTRASRKEFAKLLVAGRVDAGGLRASRSEIEKFAAERKFQGFLETSAKTGLRCEELKQAILDAIPWDELPCRTTEVLFKRLKEEIIALKDEGRVLMRFNELRETLQLRLSGESARFADAELSAVLTLLAGPGVVWELAFGSWVLLQPERINAYAQAVIRTLQADEHQRGCLMEERVLKGDLMYESSMERLEGDEERFVLLAMHQTLVERGLCLRQPTAKGNLLVFPSYYRKERPDIVQYPAVQVNYRFTGFLDELYATLVVSLHHTAPFDQDELWRYAADFKTNARKQLGIKLTRRAPGVGDLEVYFDKDVSVEEKIIFSKYVHEHLLQHARDVERLRHYVCPECGTPVGNREVAMKRLNDWLRGRPPHPEKRGMFKPRRAMGEKPSIICVGCEQRVPLWDEMEQCFASPEIQQRVRDMQEEANIELDNESKERALVGEVISTVALAAQISREKNVSDHGIDMEIEFKDDAHEATHRFVFLQLKSGDSNLRERKSDGEEVFTIKDERHARYWMASPFPVLLVIRNSEGEVRWMEIRDWLKRESDNGKKPVKQIVFKGERFDVMSVRRWRDRVLDAATTPT